MQVFSSKPAQMEYPWLTSKWLGFMDVPLKMVQCCSVLIHSQIDEQLFFQNSSSVQENFSGMTWFAIFPRILAARRSQLATGKLASAELSQRVVCHGSKKALLGKTALKQTHAVPHKVWENETNRKKSIGRLKRLTSLDFPAKGVSLKVTSRGSNGQLSINLRDVGAWSFGTTLLCSSVLFGGFHKRWYPRMDGSGNSYENWWFRSTPILGNHIYPHSNLIMNTLLWNTTIPIIHYWQTWASHRTQLVISLLNYHGDLLSFCHVKNRSCKPTSINKYK